MHGRPGMPPAHGRDVPLDPSQRPGGVILGQPAGGWGQTGASALPANLGPNVGPGQSFPPGHRGFTVTVHELKDYQMRSDLTRNETIPYVKITCGREESRTTEKRPLGTGVMFAETFTFGSVPHTMNIQLFLKDTRTGQEFLAATGQQPINNSPHAQWSGWVRMDQSNLTIPPSQCYVAYQVS